MSEREVEVSVKTEPETTTFIAGLIVSVVGGVLILTVLGVVAIELSKIPHQNTIQDCRDVCGFGKSISAELLPDTTLTCECAPEECTP